MIFNRHYIYYYFKKKIRWRAPLVHTPMDLTFSLLLCDLFFLRTSNHSLSYAP